MFQALQNFQKAHRSRIQPSEGTWEQATDKRRAVISGLQRWAKALLDTNLTSTETENDPSIDAEAQREFRRSMLSSLQMSVNVAIGRIKVCLASTAVFCFLRRRDSTNLFSNNFSHTLTVVNLYVDDDVR